VVIFRVAAMVNSEICGACRVYKDHDDLFHRDERDNVQGYCETALT
jgi:hypothetical protein